MKGTSQDYCVNRMGKDKYEIDSSLFDDIDLGDFYDSYSEDDLSDEDMGFLSESKDDPKSDVELFIGKDIGNTTDYEALVHEASTRIAVNNMIPIIPELFNSHDSRLRFLEEQFETDPPATPVQLQIIQELQSSGERIANINSMSTATEYILNKLYPDLPNSDLILKAEKVARKLDVDLPRDLLTSASRLSDWIQEHG